MRKTLVLMMVLVMAGAASTELYAGKASRSRSGGGSEASGKASGRSSHSATHRGGGRTATRGTTARVASGKATYGYLRGHRGRIGYYGHRPYFGYYYGHRHYPYSYWWWGWPWYYADFAFYGSYGHYDGRENVYVGRSSVVETDVRPRRAVVFLNGDEVGQARDYNGTWDELDISVGNHVLEFRYPGYQTLRYHVTVEPGQRLIIDERLRKGEGLDPRSTTAPPRAAPRPAPEPAASERLRSEVRPERPDSDRPAPSAGTLQRGLLHFEVLPPDAAVYLDGEFLARADELNRLHGAIPVAAGSHRIEVVRPGYESQSVDVVVEGDEPVEVDIRLKRD